MGLAISETGVNKRTDKQTYYYIILGIIQVKIELPTVAFRVTCHATALRRPQSTLHIK